MSPLTSLQSAQTSDLSDIFYIDISKSYTVQTNTQELGILNCFKLKVQL